MWFEVPPVYESYFCGGKLRVTGKGVGCRDFVMVTVSKVFLCCEYEGKRESSVYARPNTPEPTMMKEFGRDILVRRVNPGICG